MASMKYNSGESWTPISTINNNLTSATGVLPIVKGGTGATNASAALDNLGGLPITGGTISGDLSITGSLKISDNTLEYNNNTVPFIVDSGISGIWTYRKWSNGIAECWGNYNYTFNANTPHTAWGNVFYITDPTPEVSYPFTFVDTPVVEAAMYTKSGYGTYWLTPRYMSTTTMTPTYFATRATNNTQTGDFIISFIVKGRWK